MLGRSLAGMCRVGVCFALAACASNKPPQPASLTPDTRLQVAEAAEAAGERQLALSMYMTAAASAPENIALQVRCADALARAGKIAEARELLTNRLKTMPKEPDLMRALALLDLVSGRPADAVAELDKVLAIKSGDDRALVDKAVALDLLGRHAEAQNIYRQVLATAPNDPTVRNDFALSLMLEGRVDEAQKQLASIKDLNSSPERLKINLGIIYAAAGEREKSRQLLGDRIPDSALSLLTQAIRTPAAVRSNGL